MAGRASIRRGKFTLEETRGRPLHFLLDLQLGGQLIRLSSRDIVAHAGHDDETGEVQLEQYYGGLEFDEQVPDPLALLSDEPDQKSVSLTLHLWPQWDVTRFVADAHILGTARGTLYLWPEGGDHRIRLLEGRFRNPSWDVRELPLVGTLEEDPVQDAALWPDPRKRVVKAPLVSPEKGTWMYPADAAIGEYYPVPFGSPGHASSAGAPTAGRQGSPCLYVETHPPIGPERLLIAGHPVVSVGEWVQIYDAKDELAENFQIQEMNDGWGQRISYVSITAAAVITPDPEHEYWCRWERYLLTGNEIHYGMPADDHTLEQGMRGAGDILIWWLRQTDIEWDEGRLNVVRPLLNAYRIDTYAMASPDTRISPYEWLQDNLLPILPIAPRIGPGGLHFVLWPYVLDRTAAVVDLVEGENASRDSAVETSSIDDVRNTITIHYARDMETDEYQESLTITGCPERYEEGEVSVVPSWSAGNAPVIPSLYARRSYQAYQEERAEEINLDIVEDPGTVGLIAGWMIRAHAVQWYSMTYLVDQETGTRLTPGDVVTLRDDGRGLTSDVDGETVGRVGMVSSTTWSSSGLWAIELRLPAADFGEAA